MWRIWRSPRWRGAGKTGILIITLLLAYVIPLGDVTVNSMAMVKVCPSAGLHIYKTVEVEGYITYLGDGGILKKYPYQFIETRQRKANGTYFWSHYERKAGNEISRKQLDQPTAEYEVALVEWHVDKSQGVEARAEVIRNRITGEALAERIMFNPLPGWLDQILVVRWFGAGGRHGCWGAPMGMIDTAKVLIPKQSKI